jgi:hypothetical protein
VGQRQLLGGPRRHRLRSIPDRPTARSMNGWNATVRGAFDVNGACGGRGPGG